MRIHLTILFGLILFLVSCGQESAEKPAAKPLAVAEQELATIPGISTGAFAAAVDDTLVLNQPQGMNKSLPLRIWYPTATEGDLPVVLFSHGNWSDRERYDKLLRFWASHGYVVIAPTHLDGRSMARGIFNSLRYGQMGLIDGRVQDMQFLLDQLGTVEQHLAAMGGITLNKQSVVMAGHSFGAFTAQQFAGARAIDDENGVESRAGDPRVAAVLAISPPGPMFDIINERSWTTMNGPVLVTTGTWDSNAQFWPDWRMHLMSHQASTPGEQFALVIDGADHYLGNLICRPEREEAPQHDALKILNAVSVSFLNAYLGGQDKAREFLNSGKLQEITRAFATLSSR